MSHEALWTLVGRSRLDPAFADSLRRDFEGTVRQSGYTLDLGELELARAQIRATEAASPLPDLSSTGPMSAEDLEFRNRKLRQRFSNQIDRAIELNAKATDVVRKTFDNAASTYRTITWMNRIMFGVGILLFVFAAAYAVWSSQKVYALFFGGLGAASFVALFLLGPIEKTQRALSSLVQVEIAFMSYFEQITFWESYAQIPRGTPPMPDPAAIEKASLELQNRTRETIELLQRYVGEVTAGRRSRRGRSEGAPATGARESPPGP